MSNEILLAILASLSTFLISLLTFFQARENAKRQSADYEASKRRRTTTHVLELRLDHYPKGIEITEALSLGKNNSIAPAAAQTALDELQAWRSGIVRLIISEPSLQAWYDLRNCLSKQPAFGSYYSQEQINKIWEARNTFRRSLRQDIGLLHAEDDNRMF